MAIYTPHGLRINLPWEIAFGLISRLGSTGSAIKVLKTTEGIELSAFAFSFLAAIICFILKVSPVWTGLVVYGTHLLLTTLVVFGVFIIPGQVRLGIIYRARPIPGFNTIVLIALGLLLTQWQSLLAAIVARILGFFTTSLLDTLRSRRNLKFSGWWLGSAERNFLSAYRINAWRQGITDCPDLSDSELLVDSWRPTLENLAETHPDLVSKFDSVCYGKDLG